MYVLVTPARNEERYLPGLVEGVREQSRRPEAWVIVDDGSDDRTPELIDEFAETNSWITGVHLSRDDEYDTEFGYAKVVSAGLERMDDVIERERLDAEYVGVLDCDIRLDDDYFEKLIAEMRSESRCGIASGVLHTGESLDPAEGAPWGGAMLFDRRCLDDVGEYPITPSPDAVFRLKAENRGWETMKTAEAEGRQLRPPQSARGRWSGYKRKAVGRHYLDYHPVNAFLTGAYHCTRYPFYPGLAYLYGYFSRFVRRAEQTDDPEVAAHYRERRFEALKRRIAERLP